MVVLCDFSVDPNYACSIDTSLSGVVSSGTYFITFRPLLKTLLSTMKRLTKDPAFHCGYMENITLADALFNAGYFNPYTVCKRWPEDIELIEKCNTTSLSILLWRILLTASPFGDPIFPSFCLDVDSDFFKEGGDLGQPGCKELYYRTGVFKNVSSRFHMLKYKFPSIFRGVCVKKALADFFWK
jgi:hypothetical protein